MYDVWFILMVKGTGLMFCSQKGGRTVNTSSPRKVLKEFASCSSSAQ